jgi:hypothetical protein
LASRADQVDITGFDLVAKLVSQVDVIVGFDLVAGLVSRVNITVGLVIDFSIES